MDWKTQWLVTRKSGTLPILHETYTVLMFRSDSTLLKRLISLQKDLNPGSEFHKKHDLVGLKGRVKQVEQVMTGLPSDKQGEYATDLCMGVTAIVMEAVKRKKVKPDLVVEDDLEC
jgi:hypothetical protein